MFMVNLLLTLFVSTSNANLNVYGQAPWCVANNLSKQCYYYDVQSCQRAASVTFNGMCVPR